VPLAYVVFVPFERRRQLEHVGHYEEECVIRFGLWSPELETFVTIEMVLVQEWVGFSSLVLL
jgi:hypothetical protein